MKLGRILEKVIQRQSQREHADLNDCDNETCTSTQFSQTQKKQLIVLQEQWNVIALFFLSLESTAQIVTST